MTCTAATPLDTAFGRFLATYHRAEDEACLTLSVGDVAAAAPLIRLHSACLFGEALFGLECDCQAQLRESLQLMAQVGCGVLVYLFQEGRGIGLEAKIRVLETRRQEQLDTVESMQRCGYAPDMRRYEVAAAALRDLGVCSQLRLISNNPHKRQALEGAGFTIIEQVHLTYAISSQAYAELRDKADRLGYAIDFSRLTAAAPTLSPPPDQPAL